MMLAILMVILFDIALELNFFLFSGPREVNFIMGSLDWLLPVGFGQWDPLVGDCRQGE